MGGVLRAGGVQAPPAADRSGDGAEDRLLERLLAAPTARLVCVVAPPGYGKTTLLAQWAERRGGRVAWVSVDRRDNDPAVLLTYLAAAVDRVEPIDPRVSRLLATPAAAASLVPGSRPACRR